MSRSRKKWFSLLLIALGAVLLFLGARDFIGSILSQRQAARRWEESQRKAAEEARKRSDAEARTTPPLPDLGPALARLSIPRLESSWFVFSGAGKKELRLGPGHVRGTALPGTRGNAVIAAHRDTHFRVLKDIRKGDELVVETRYGRFRYKVSRISIVKPTNTKSLQPTQQPVMNLITCYPFYFIGPAPMRYVVETRLEEADYAQLPPPNRSPS